MPDRRITIAELIKQHQDRTGDSYAVLARKSGLSKAKIGQLATAAQPHAPRHETVEKLASGLGLPVRIVQQAALASAGLAPADYAGEQRLDLIVTMLQELDPEDVDNAELFIRGMLKRQQDRDQQHRG